MAYKRPSLGKREIRHEVHMVMSHPACLIRTRRLIGITIAHPTNTEWLRRVKFHWPEIYGYMAKQQGWN